MIRRHPLICLLAFTFTANTQSEIITVDDDGPADFSTIQAAIDAAANGDMIMVAPGVYQASPKAPQVVDLLGKSLTLQSVKGPASVVIDGENSNRGLLCSNAEGPATLVDGFTFTNCRHADGAGGRFTDASPTIRNCVFIDNNGQGLHLINSSAIIENCTFQGNNAPYGGGLQAIDSDPVIDSCQFIDNVGLLNGGGAHFAYCGGTITNTLFDQNRTQATSSDGGGLHIAGSTTILTECTFSANSSFGQGGGLFMSWPDKNPLTLSNCTFHENSSGNGAAAKISSSNDATVKGCVFLANTTNYNTHPYSTLDLNADSNCLLSECTFDLNSPGLLATSAKTFGQNVTVEDCTFKSNSGGLAVGSPADGQATVFNCRFEANEGMGFASGVHAYGAGPVEVLQSEFTNNTYVPVICQSLPMNLSECTFRGHDIYLFVELEPDSEITYHDNVFCENNDEIGDGEDLGNCVVNSCADSNADGTPDACEEQVDLQSLLEDAMEGDTIQLEAGVFAINRTLDPLSKAITIRGQVDSEGNPTTIIDGQGVMRTIHCGSKEDVDTIFENLVITGGWAVRGGGMLCGFDARPTLNNCVFRNNTAYVSDGGGLHSSGAPDLNGCRFFENSAAGDGGGLYCHYGNIYGNISLTDCVFKENTALGDGGGMHCGYGSRPYLTGCVFQGNTAQDAGGGVYCGGWSLTIRNSVVCGNGPDQMVGEYENCGSCIQESCGACDPGLCPTDLTCNGMIDGEDLGQLFAQWGECETCTADFNGDGEVDGQDLGLLFVAWGPCD